MFRTVAALAEAAGGELHFGDPGAQVRAISTDTRKIAPGDCFIALAGQNRDGHAFVADAINKGAGAVIVSVLPVISRDCSAAVIKVGDTLYALGELARRHRMMFDIPVIAVSGSNGKTSTKEMIAAIFSPTREVLKNKGNFNNLIGLPLTLLGLEERHSVAVVEMGINVPGEMERLAQIGAATAAVITNIHPAHLEGLGSIERIMQEKGKLWTSLGPGGIAVVNADDPMLSHFAKQIKARKVTFSLSNGEADVSVCSQIVVSEANTSFRINAGGNKIAVSLPAVGLHYAQNALAATAAALVNGASAGEVEAGLRGYGPVPQRMNCIKLPGGRVLVDDTYNANPRSMIASVEAVLCASSGGPFVAVLGDMRELGPQGPSLHFEVGKRIGEAKPSRLIVLGDLGIEIINGARAAGLDESVCFHAAGHAEAADLLRRVAPEGAWILVKGSRGMMMEKVVQALVGMNAEELRDWGIEALRN
ncbi:MAG TPA: UDP-N-acetylmuramoyl-tripeptide--D-alanyl-D-alanine ligase [Syntrophobacteraceae bacterium]|nr:UDP-N-acetylmuramoyl-tripeptide--D-alanyl-D-alanine ligase [Syntrophobacteraceae bacterium]